MSQLGLAVVGAGILGQRHARVWRELDGSRLVGVADLDEERARRAVAGSSARWATDSSALLGDPQVDAVSVALPDHLHVAVTAEALRRGKHVLVEKPLATSHAEAVELVETANRTDRILQVNLSQRWLAEYAHINDLVAAGEIGRPQFAVSVKRDTVHVPTEMIQWAASTSPLFFMTSHDLDLLRWFLRAEPVRVVAHEVRGVLTDLGVDVHDAIQALVEFEGGVSVILSTAWTYPDTYPMVAEDRLEIVGTDGVIEYRSRDRILEVHTSRTARTTRFTGPATATEVNGRLAGAFVESCRSFLASVTTGTQPLTSGADSLGAIACQEAIIASARSGGRPIEIG